MVRKEEIPVAINNRVYMIVGALSVILVSGCQSTMKVSVQRIEPAGEIRPEFAHARTDVESVAATVSSLMNLQSSLQSLENAWTRDELINNAIPLPESLSEDINRGLGLVEKLPTLDKSVASVQSAAYIVKVQSMTEQTKQRVQELLAVNSNIINEYRNGHSMAADAIKRIQTAKKLNDDLKPFSRGIEDTLWITKSYINSSKPGFGGYMSMGVSRISAGDPNYKSVLEGSPQGEPITETVATVSGNSTLIFVQESPVQMRFYTVDLNAEDLVKNISQISSKAVNAALKFSAPLPTEAP